MSCLYQFYTIILADVSGFCRTLPDIKSAAPCVIVHGAAVGRAVLQRKMAERAGFEPAMRQRRIPVFETGAFNHSATSPQQRTFYYTRLPPAQDNRRHRVSVPFQVVYSANNVDGAGRGE